jgi:hypothetical protein
METSQLSPSSNLNMTSITTIELQWVSPTIVARDLFRGMMDIDDNPFYDAIPSLKIIICTLTAFIYAFYILAYPPKYRKLSIFLLVIPISYAFLHHTKLAPHYTFCDTYGRFLYIWLAHMSHEVIILEFEPAITKENDGWKSRMRAAYKVLFSRNHHSTGPHHNHTRTSFVVRHLWKATYLYTLQILWTVIRTRCIVVQPVHGADKAIFFRRLPHSLNAVEMYHRFEHFLYWCVINMFLYEAYHSVFAILFVLLRFDTPGEWSMSLFGPASDAWSVRRYWGKHWHNYIYESFSSHTKILTRDWLGMQRGRVSTRLVENTLVFGASGVMHSAVRWVQDAQSRDYWVITFWYVGQMLPIVIEDIVQAAWNRKKKEYVVKESKCLMWLERLVGYAWVVGFNMWSITKYVHTRDAWGDAAMEIRFAREVKDWEARGATLSRGNRLD